MVKILHKLFAWRINNFYMFPSGFRINSPTFSIENSKKVKFSLSIMSKIHAEAGEKEHFTVFLSRKNDKGPGEVVINVEIVFHDVCSDQKEHFKLTCDFSEGMERSQDIIADRLSSHVILVCKVSPLQAVSSSYDDYECLSKDFSALFDTGLYSDITIITDYKKFKVHKFILKTRCPKLLEQLVETDQINVYYLPGMKEEDMKAILQYVYTGKFDGSEVMFESVFASARTCGLNYISSIEEITRVVDKIDVSTVLHKFYLNMDTFKVNKEHFLSVIRDPLNIINRVDASAYEKLISTDTCLICCKFKQLKKGKCIFMRCSLSIENSTGGNHFLKQCHHLFEDEEEWEIVSEIDATAIRNLLGKSNICLQVKMDMSVYGGWSRDAEHTISDFRSYSVSEVWKNYRTHLKEIYSNIYFDEKYSDLTLSVENLILHVHKAVLCCRLKNFSENSLNESAISSYLIEDIPETAIRSLFSYIYTGSTASLWDYPKAVWLYVACVKFEMPILRDTCRRYMKHSICEEYICDVKVLAIYHDDKILKKCVSDFTLDFPDTYWFDKQLKILKNSKIYSEIWRSFIPPTVR